MRNSGGNSQTRRRERRAAERQAASALAKGNDQITADEVDAIRALAASAQLVVQPETAALERFDAVLEIEAPRQVATLETAAWAAGIIDGEGTIFWHNDRIYLRATNTSEEMIDRLVALCGGSKHVEKPSGAKAQVDNPRRNTKWRWTITGHDAYLILETLAPLMTAKREKAEEVIGLWRENLSLRRPGSVEKSEARMADAGWGSFRFELRDLQLVAAGGGVATAPQILEPEAPATPRGPVEWTALFVPEGTLTDDGRAFAPGSLVWRDLPLTLMGLNETSAEGGHDGAVACGRIDQLWRDGMMIRAGGVFSEDDLGAYYATNVGDGTIRGLSVDIAIHEYEIGPRSDYFDQDGNWIETRPERPADEEVADLLFGEQVENPIFVVTKGVIGMATVCPFPAFAEANISLVASGAGLRFTHQGGFVVVERPSLTASAETVELAGEPLPACATCGHDAMAHDGAPGEATEVVVGEEAELAATIPDGACTVDGCSCSEYEMPDDPEEVDDQASLTAAAAGLAPLLPPAEWFQDPGLSELTPITVDDDGRIYGHAWAWGTCHTGFPEVCTTAPRSNTNYAYFHTGELECEGGERMPVGRITFDTGHAGPRASRAAAVAHYDDTGKVGAYVVVGEDEFGGWVAGTIAADVSATDAQKLRGAAPSGDWRAVNGNLELIGLLAVNVAGFPVPRPRALVAAGDGEQRMLALTAAGVAEMLRERTDEDNFREIEALADQARGVFGDLAAAARG